MNEYFTSREELFTKCCNETRRLVEMGHLKYRKKEQKYYFKKLKKILKSNIRKMKLVESELLLFEFMFNFLKKDYRYNRIKKKETDYIKDYSKLVANI